MYASAIIASTALLASSVIGAPLRTPYEWSVAQYQGGASPATSYYTFKVSGPEYHSTDGSLPANVPAFDTTCRWAAINGAGYQDCDPLPNEGKLKAKLVNVPNAQGSSTYNVFILHGFTDGSSHYFEIGNQTVTSDPAEPTSFSVSPNAIRVTA